MKMIEKMILCCIWICIAIVAVLIKDQSDLNQKILLQKQAEELVPEVQELEENIVLNEHEVMDIVASNLPVMSEASLEFSKDGVIELKVSVDDALIEEAKKLISNDAVSAFLPFLKGMEVGCQATVSYPQMNLVECKAGMISVPKSMLSVLEEKLNETWKGLLEREGIESVEIKEDEMRMTLQQE